MSLIRGDIVLYNNKAYYFQPWGTGCFLYDKREYIGSSHKSRWQPSRKMVTKAPPGAVVIYEPTETELKEQEEFAKRVAELAIAQKSFDYMS